MNKHTHTQTLIIQLRSRKQGSTQSIHQTGRARAKHVPLNRIEIISSGIIPLPIVA